MGSVRRLRGGDRLRGGTILLSSDGADCGIERDSLGGDMGPVGAVGDFRGTLIDSVYLCGVDSGGGEVLGRVNEMGIDSRESGLLAAR